jgi:hypothetical protein
MAAILFLPFENRTFLSGFRMVASQDRFIKKRVMNKIFFMPKRSRLVRKISGLNFKCIRKPDKKSVRGMTIWIPDGSVFGCLLYLDVFIFQTFTVTGTWSGYNNCEVEIITHETSSPSCKLFSAIKLFNVCNSDVIDICTCREDIQWNMTIIMCILFPISILILFQLL